MQENDLALAALDTLAALIAESPTCPFPYDEDEDAERVCPRDGLVCRRNYCPYGGDGDEACRACIRGWALREAGKRRAEAV